MCYKPTMINSLSSIHTANDLCILCNNVEFRLEVYTILHEKILHLLKSITLDTIYESPDLYKTMFRMIDDILSKDIRAIYHYMTNDNFERIYGSFVEITKHRPIRNMIKCMVNNTSCDKYTWWSFSFNSYCRRLHVLNEAIFECFDQIRWEQAQRPI